MELSFIDTAKKNKIITDKIGMYFLNLEKGKKIANFRRKDETMRDKTVFYTKILACDKDVI